MKLIRITAKVGTTASRSIYVKEVFARRLATGQVKVGERIEWRTMNNYWETPTTGIVTKLEPILFADLH